MSADPAAALRPPSLRYFAWLYAPAPLRGPLAALLRLEAEILGSVDPRLDHAVSHVRLAWWQDECTRLLMDRPSHPLARELAAAHAERAMPPPDLRELPQIAAFELAGTPDEAGSALEAARASWSRAVFATGASLCIPGSTAPERPALDFAASCGPRIREIEQLCDLADAAAHGRIFVAAGAIARDGTGWAAQPWDAHRAELVRSRLLHCLAALADSAAALPGAQCAALRPLLVWASLASRRARDAIASLPWQYTAGRWRAVGDGWLAWRAGVAATRGTPHRSLRTLR